MKVAIVKQLLDTVGPWTSLRWEESGAESLFRFWPCRGLHWEMTTLLEADWYIIPQRLESDYTRDAVRRHEGRAQLIEKHVKNVTPIEAIPFTAGYSGWEDFTAITIAS